MKRRIPKLKLQETRNVPKGNDTVPKRIFLYKKPNDINKNLNATTKRPTLIFVSNCIFGAKVDSQPNGRP